MRALTIGSFVYLCPDKEANRLDQLLERAENAKGDVNMFAAQAEYNRYLDLIKSDKKPIAEIYAGHMYL